MPQVSAGLLMVRIHPTPEFFLIHPGGPFYQRKHLGIWSIPKGLVDEDEDLLLAAKREFLEETGIAPVGEFQEIGFVTMKSRKTVYAWCFEGVWDEEQGIQSNHFEVEWPPKSGKKQSFPEADSAKWCAYDEARTLILPYQLPFLERALALIKTRD